MEKFKNMVRGIFGLNVKDEQERAKELLIENYKKKIEENKYNEEGPEQVGDSQGPIYAVGRHSLD